MFREALADMGGASSKKLQFDILYFLTWLEIPLFVGVATAIATIMALAIRPSPRRAWIRGRAIWRRLAIFAGVWALLAFVMIVVPMMELYDTWNPATLAEAFHRQQTEGWNRNIWDPDVLRQVGAIAWPPLPYLSATFATAFGFAVHFALRRIPPSPRWRLAPLFLAGMSWPIPAAWWTAMAAAFPSRWWTPLRPIFLAISAVIPILVLAGNQPTYMPYTGHAIGRTPRLSILNSNMARDELRQCLDSYQAVPVPGRDEALVKCLDGIGLVQRRGDAWYYRLAFTYGDAWNEASYDFDARRAYLYDGYRKVLHVLDIDAWREIDRYVIDEKTVSLGSDGLRQAILPDENLLVVGQRPNTSLITIDLTTGGTIASRELSVPGDELWRIVGDARRGQILVLTRRFLFALSPDDLSTIRTIELPGDAFEMIHDRRRDRLLVGFARLGRVIAYDPATFLEVRSAPAPLAIRAMAIDETHDLVFFSSFLGVIETRRGEDLARLSRRRILPWIRDMAPLPGAGVMVVTSGYAEPVVWDYRHAPHPFDFADAVLRIVEYAARFAIEADIMSRIAPNDWATPGDSSPPSS
ncbi:PQQ-like beta-propeller repeat protein [bacterium]|nr:PQQ-like beta-propeller repeat protein [bacterium]